MAPADPYFDCRINTWILSRYPDVAAALREPFLVPASPQSAGPAVLPDARVHAEFRTEALRALAPVNLQKLEAQFVPLANLMAAALPTSQPVDLMEHYARPWSLQVAGIAADVPADRSERLSSLAHSVFEAACEPYHPAVAATSQEAVAELALFFQGAPRLNMQMFIALAQSLPAFLGNAWLELLQHPAQLRDLFQDPSLLPRAIDELLRLAGPAKAQFRQAAAPVTICGCAIERDRHVTLRLDIANRDPQQFPDPDQLRFEGRSPAHLAFGTGLHACVAATLIRMAAAAATRALIGRLHFAGHYTAVPVDAFAVRYVKRLNAALGPKDASGPALCL